MQRANAVMNWGRAAKKIIPNSDNPANKSASYAEKPLSSAPSSPVPPHAATGGRRRLTPPDSPSSLHPPPDCAKLYHGQNSQSATCITSNYPACFISHAHSTPTDNQPIHRHTRRGLTYYSQHPVSRQKRSAPPNSNMKSRASLVTEGKGKTPNTKSGG